MANIQHPEGLEEGLRQSAAGEVVDLGGFEQYILIEDRKVGEIFELSEEDKDRWANGRIYERFLITNEYGENYAEPIRPDILAEYTENGLGYFIQQIEGGFRYISVEAGEEDIFGAPVATKKAAIQGAVNDWRKIGMGDSWADWSRQMAKDAEAPDAPSIEASKVEEFLLGSAAGIALTENEIKEIAVGLAEYLSKN